MSKKAIYIASTKQYIGKTTTCCALLSGLTERFENVGYMKPVGQIDQEVKGLGGEVMKVDKDVRLFKEFFGLQNCSYRDMSPVMIGSGYTKRYLDGKIDADSQIENILKGYNNLVAANDFLVVEGTGHCGVGSIIGLDNAWVAKQLGLDMVLICSAGLGSSFDELRLNQLKCEQHGVKIRGVIMNRVHPTKVEVTRKYIEKALAPWGVPLIGCVPYYTYSPLLKDLEALFQEEVLTGKQHRERRFESIELVATSLQQFLKIVHLPEYQNTLWVLHATRIDLLQGVLEHIEEHKAAGGTWGGGLILAGSTKHCALPSDVLELKIRKAVLETDVPVLRIEHGLEEVMKLISNYLNGASLNLSADDQTRTRAGIQHVTSHIDFDLLCHGAK